MLGRNLIQAASGNVAADGANPNAWDIEYGSFDGTPKNFFDVNIEATRQGSNFVEETEDVTFSADGTKMYVVDQETRYILQFGLSTAWDIATASYTQKVSTSFGVGITEYNPTGLFFKPDGTKYYLIGMYNDSVYQFDLSTAWDISTESYNQTFSVATQETQPQAVFFKTDGTKMFITGFTNDDVKEYDLSTAWDISTASYSQNFSVSSQDTLPRGLFFKSDGTKMYMVGASNDRCYQYTLSTAWDVSTASYDSKNEYLRDQDGSPTGVFFKPDGTKMFIAGLLGNAVYQYSLSTAHDVSSASYSAPTTKKFYVGDKEAGPQGLTFKTDGTKMYVIGSSGDDVNEYSLSTAWDITTASYVRATSVSTEETSPQDVTFKTDGTKMYVIGQTGDEVNEYDLSTAWDTSTLTYNQTFSVSSQDTRPRGIDFKTDGTKMYIVGDTGNDVNEYALTTAWDISTASYTRNKAVSSQDFTPVCVKFQSDGTRMYVLGEYYKAINAYTLSTAWDISTASFETLFPVGALDSYPSGMCFKPEGDKFYVVGTYNDNVYEFDISAS